MKPVTLLSDFGDPEYPAMMKGVILKINTAIPIVDISHSISPGNIIEGAFVLRNAVKYFPEGTIHVAVVDPGVGSQRKPIMVECERGILVGPDNGLLLPAAEVLGMKEIREITNSDMISEDVSATFHGRDIFAPAAAHLALAPELASEVGAVLTTPPVKLVLDEPTVTADRIEGTIYHIDNFGNLITNVPKEMLSPFSKNLGSGAALVMNLGENNYKINHHSHYSSGEKCQLISLIASSGHLELAVPNGSAVDMTGAKVGDRFTLKLG